MSQYFVKLREKLKSDRLLDLQGDLVDIIIRMHPANLADFSGSKRVSRVPNVRFYPLEQICYVLKRKFNQLCWKRTQRQLSLHQQLC
jgi:hypothetical protein